MSSLTLDPPSEDLLEPDEPPRRRRTVLWASIAVGILVAVVAVAIGTRPPAGTRQTASPLIGHPVPLSAGQTVSGAAFTPDSLHGRWAIVNFFATWCVPCQHEHPELVSFSHRHTGDVQVVSIVFQDDNAHVTSFFAQHGGDWPVVRDPNGRTALDFGVTGVPESYLVDPSGIVVARMVGGVQADALDALLQQARAGTNP
jgi:cytochrome c biogenesis protein CcmG/thiol:disulfide interchange protein DsbE